MFYKINVSLAFDALDPANDILEEAKRHIAQAHTINPGQLNEEKGYIILEQCFHDEEPQLPCVKLYEEYTPVPNP